MKKIHLTFWKNWRFWVLAPALLALLAALLGKGPIAPDELFKSLSRFTAPTLFLCSALCTFQVWAMGLRLKALAPPKTEYFPVLWAVSYGQFANAFFPARAGDALKIALLCDAKKGAGLSFPVATGILVGDRPIDLVALFLWIGLSGSYNVQAFQSEKMPSFGKILIILGLVILSFYLFYRFILQNKFPKLKSKLLDFGRSTSSVLNIRHGLPSLAAGLAVWCLEFFSLMALVHSIGYPLSFSEVVAVIVILNLAIAIPLSIANVGPFEAAVTYALTKLGVPTEMALSVAILHHAFQVLGTCLSTFGLWICWKIRQHTPKILP